MESDEVNLRVRELESLIEDENLRRTAFKVSNHFDQLVLKLRWILICVGFFLEERDSTTQTRLLAVHRRVDEDSWRKPEAQRPGQTAHRQKS